VSQVGSLGHGPGHDPAGLWFGILGPLLVRHDGSALALGPWKRQLVLAALLCHANSLVTVDALIDTLWQDRQPRTARKNLHVYVSSLRGQLRAACGDPRIIHLPGGYLLRADDDELDSLSFDQQVSAAREPRPDRCADAVAARLGEAIGLWRGQVLAGMRDVPLIGTVAERMEARLLTAFEEWAEAEVAVGGAGRAIERITAVAHEQPFRERLRLVQMLALIQLGRRTEALAVYDELRLTLARDLGLSPGTALARCYHSLLEGESAAHRGLAPGVPARSATGTFLPPDSPSFTGRDECVRDILRAVSDRGERLVILSGPVGVGKTALAVHCARRLCDLFPDGQVFIRIGGAAGPEAGLARLMRTMAAPGWPEPDYDACAQWQHWLAGRRALIVLDGARTQAELRPYLPDIGDSAVIVAARSRLAGLGEAYRLTVPLFTIADATELLGRIIGTGRLATDPSAARQLVAAVGLLPLGVRLMGDRLAGLRHVPLSEYLHRMARSPHLLDELALGNQVVRDRLDEGVDDLSDCDQRAFLRLASLPSPVFTLAQAADVLETDKSEAIRILETLLEASLVTAPDCETVAHTVRYETPPLTYARGRERARSQAAAARG
jgi:DNA-binding SARP family transcriptional activator